MSGRRGRAFAISALPIVLAGCMPTGVTEQARAVTTLWTQFLVAAAIVGGTVWVLISVMLVRYRRRSADAALIQAPAAPTDSRPVELAWTAIPILIVLILFGMTLVALGTVDARSPSKVTVDVTAFRWQWRFDYEGTPVRVVGDPNTVARMVVPVGEPIHIVLTSADVDHAFYVPQFLFKRDVVPGVTNQFDLQIPASDAGQTYRGQCAELCGIGHRIMVFEVHAVAPADFDAWMQKQIASANATPPPAASGAAAGPTIPLVAKGVKFDQSALTVPATGFTVHYDNEDAGTPHDFVVLDNAGTKVYGSKTVTGVAQADFAVPAIPAGTYKFECSIHPTLMFGTLTVQ